MGLRERLFGRRKSVDDAPDPIADLVLEKLKVGYLVDYDLQTWRVTGYSRYRFSGVDDVEEWELSANGEQRYLERAGDAEREQLQSIYAKEQVDDGDVASMMAALEELGVADYVQRLAERQAVLALEALDGLEITAGAREALRQLTDFLMTRPR